METWKVDIIRSKIESVKRQMFSLEVDLRVARRVNNAEMEKQVTEMMKLGEAQLLALEEELQ